MRISVVIPFHFMDNWQFFLTRCLESIEYQSFKDYEVILMKVGSMPVTSNRVMEAAKGELIKVLYMDDMLATPSSLQEIVDSYPFEWLISGCNHTDNIHMFNDHFPLFDDRIMQGINTIGSPSVLTIPRKNITFFDENLSWVLDIDLYQRLYRKYGSPKILDSINVTIGLHSGQTTHKLTNNEKEQEVDYLSRKQI